jgi:nucleotide-binding universal stress UspA family protein
MPKIFEKILCPIAFDQNSSAAIKFAYELADARMSVIYLLYVLSPPTVDTAVLEPHPILTEGIAERELQKLANQHLPSNFAYQIVLRKGDPASLIGTVAEELQADLIVMPTHGRQGIMHMIIGSVAERVIREAKTPVLTLRPSHHNSVTTTSTPQ